MALVISTLVVSVISTLVVSVETRTPWSVYQRWQLSSLLLITVFVVSIETRRLWFIYQSRNLSSHKGILNAELVKLVRLLMSTAKKSFLIGIVLFFTGSTQGLWLKLSIVLS